MYLNANEAITFQSAAKFNYNMGCIWIDSRYPIGSAKLCLTITWDVFECLILEPKCTSACKFNYNMGCIWISTARGFRRQSYAFNYNMGCIWISYLPFWRVSRLCLTITWDVFEWCSVFLQKKCWIQFNYNMGCIWIPQRGRTGRGGDCLTITWDVFESSHFIWLSICKNV